MNNSVLGKRTIEVNNEEQNKKIKIEKASHFLNHIQKKIQKNKPLTDEQYEAIPRALSNIPVEEHYKWPEFTESLEALDGGKKRKNKSKRKTRKIKRKSRKYNK